MTPQNIASKLVYFDEIVFGQKSESYLGNLVICAGY